MKKKVLTALTGAMLATSVAMAAPITDLDKGQSVIGYNHYDLDISGDTVDNDSFSLENALTNNLIVGVERNSFNDAKATDVYAQYKLDPNFRLIVGNRDYSDGPSKMFYGLGAKTSLAPKVDGYASVITNSIVTEWQAGLAYQINHQTALNLGYKSSKEDGFARADGLGFGVGIKF